MNKNKKIIITIVSILVIALISFAFFKIIRSSAKAEDSKNSIKLYVLKTDRFLKDAIQEYKNQYPNITVEEVIFEDIIQYSDKLSKDIMAGEGPDVVFFNSYAIGDINKVIKNGIFTDLKPLIDNNKDFSLKDYNEKILDVGTYDKKLLFIPLNYSVNIMSTTSEILGSNNIDLFDSNLSQKDFLDRIEPYISSMQYKNDKYVFSQPIYFDEFIQSTGVEFMDYEKNKIFMDSAEFKQAVNDYKKIYKYMAPNGVAQQYKNREYDMLKNRDILFNNFRYDMVPGGLGLSSSFINSLMGENQFIYALPQYKGGNKYVGFAENCIAINSKSKSKNHAFNFINTALSVNMQSHYSLMGVPANNTALDVMINDRRGEDKEVIFNDLSFIQRETPKELKEKYYKIINNIEKFEFRNIVVGHLISEPLYDYFQDKITYEKAITEIKNKLTVYLNE